jgi:RNA polymerase sigma-70 factor (ECF subfamily)
VTKQEKFMELLEPVHGRLERFAMSISSGYDEAKDIVSETILEAYQCFGSLKDEKAFLSFIFTIARRKKSRLARKNQRYVPFSNNNSCYLADSSISPENATDISLLHNAMNSLGEKEKEAISLFEIAGFSVKEIAGIQGSSVAAVKVRLFRARKRLSKLLGVSEAKEQKKINNLIESEVIL